MSERIVWTTTKYGISGRAGGFQLFSVAQGLRRDSTSPWSLDTRLPIRSGQLGQVHPTMTHAKVAAERILSAFIKRIDGPTTTSPERAEQEECA